MPNAISAIRVAPFIVPAQHSATENTTQANKAPPMDAPTFARLQQFKVIVDNQRNAVDQQQKLVYKAGQPVKTSLAAAAALASQLGLEQPASVLGREHPELLSHPDVLEVLKKQQQRETQLARETGTALDATRRGYSDLLRSFNFLLPHETREDRLDGEEEPVMDPVMDPSASDASGLVWNSYAEFHAMVAALIGALQENWMSKYQDAMEKFLEFYERFSDAMDSLEPVGVGDNHQVELWIKTVKKLLRELKADFQKFENALASFGSKAAADAFKASMNLPGLKVVEGENGQWHVMMDLSSVEDILTRLPDSDNVVWDSAAYAAWVSFKDGNVEQVKHMSKVIGEKLNEMTQKFDSIVKVLSATIDKMTEVMKNYINAV